MTRCTRCDALVVASTTSQCITCETSPLCDFCAEAHVKVLPRHALMWSLYA
jgi:hypothetical protein